MKKIKFTALAVCLSVLFSVSTTSCTSTVEENAMNETETVQSNSILLSNLSAFNDKELSDAHMTRVSGHTLDIIMADVYGAYKGGRKG